jgi:hypothetical protein
LGNLSPEIENLDALVVIGDNNLTDYSNENITDWLTVCDAKRCILSVQVSSNYGFSIGDNIGIKARKARYYLLYK